MVWQDTPMGELLHFDPDMLASNYLKAEVGLTRIRHFIPSYGPSWPDMKVIEKANR